jgi:cytochrome c-type biogenesis protein CcmF
VNIGNLLILLAFAGLLASTISFFLAARGKKRFFSLGRTAYKYFTVFVLLASALLLYYFLVGDYSYRYVYDYSSSDLSVFYLISSFWAGQRGTYLLWLLLLAIFGFYLLKRGRQYTAYGMFFYGLVNIFFGVILLVLSPFEKLPIPQPDGAGLNPLLKDPWMVIHPPVIFIGYAIVTLPCVIALAALIKKNYDDWLAISFAPVAFGALTLAAGNIMGGFWAYKTLGWGGYWAWDPVENSSFIPWMVALALLHGMILERKNGAMRKTNLFLALFTFLLVVYGTFLTRSGVLADFSVHSFVDLGTNIYLITFMVGFILLSMAIYFSRIREIKAPALNLSFTSRDFALLVSVWALVLIAVMVLAGTSWPLVTTIFGNPETVDTAVYTRVTFPLAILIGAFLGIAPFMVAASAPITSLLKKVILSGVISIIMAVVAFVLGVKSIQYLFFIFFASLAFFSNVQVLLRYLPGRLWQAAPQVAHFGFAMMLIGILGSSAYATHQKVIIDRDDTDQAYGLDITYVGMAGKIETPDNEIILSINDDGDVFEARPRLFWASRMNGLMKKPYIKRYLGYDLYLAPEQIQDLHSQNGVKLTRGETVDLGDYSVKFLDFEQGAHSMGGSMNFGAKIEVTDIAGYTDTTIPMMEFAPDQNILYHDSPLLEGRTGNPVRLEKIFADEGAVLVSIEGLTPYMPSDRLVMEVSKKPTMNILWAGSILLALGGIMSVRNRWKMSALDRGSS